ncbi:hypothetical protein A6R68_12692 [Neotoma lepida]|uniref:IQ domain-containing protein E n=1 Tax=Neotoma lepida TaxID=56216 RepID=A0A1A6H557_NEOLE|nr:hypothetical protein A6R68_12692 [Neotoma lepida]
MSQDTADLASETGDDSLSAITFDSDFETKTKRKDFHKPPSTSPKSPYYSKPRKATSWRSLKTAGSMPLSSRMSLTPQKLWLGASKQGSVTQPLSSTLTSEHVWTHPHSCTPDHLTEAMRAKRADLRRSGSHGHVSGSSVYREKEDMYDEIIELKKGTDFIRTLAEKKPDTGWVSRASCSKESLPLRSKLQTDLKTTNLEEMRIAMETYYEEIHRLQTLLASTEATGKKPILEKKLGVKRQKKMSSALLNLTRSVQELTEENQSLKEDLDRMLSNSPTVSKIKGYVDWSKPRLLRRIAELEKKVSSSESPKPSTSDLVKLNPLVHSSSNNSVQKQLKEDQPKEDQPKGDPSEDQERLQGTMNKLLRAKINLEKELEMARESEKRRQEQEQALREEIEALTTKCQELEEAKRQERDSTIAVTQEAHPELLAPSPCSSRHSKPDSDNEPDSHNSAGEEGGSQPPTPCSEERREAAIRILQAQWKAHRHKVLLRRRGKPSFLGREQFQSKEFAAREEAITVIQSILRGYLAQATFMKAGKVREVLAARDRRVGGCWDSRWVLPRTDMPYTEWSPSGKIMEDSCGEAAKAEDEAEEPAALQPYLGTVSVGLCAQEELKEAAAVEPTPSSPPSVPDFPQGGHWDCLSPLGLEAVSRSSVKDVLSLDGCDERSSSTASAQLSLGMPPPSPLSPVDLGCVGGGASVLHAGNSCLHPVTDSTWLTSLSVVSSPPGLQSLSPLPVEDVCSDDSDDIIFSPFLPRKKSPSPF